MPIDDVSVILEGIEVKSVQAITYPGVQIGTLLKAMHEFAIDDTLRKDCSAYGRLVPNNAKSNHHILTRLYNLLVLSHFVYIGYICFGNFLL